MAGNLPMPLVIPKTGVVVRACRGTRARVCVTSLGVMLHFAGRHGHIQYADLIACSMMRLEKTCSALTTVSWDVRIVAYPENWTFIHVLLCAVAVS